MNPDFDFSPARPLIDWPKSQRMDIVGVLTDIDDTLTEQGLLMPQALSALQALRQSGIEVMAVTGRPAGWSEPFALQWPLRGIIAENGAVALWRNASGGLSKDWLQTAAERRTNARRLQEAARDVLAQMPWARLATDSAGRETDIAIDHSEYAQLDAAEIGRVVALLKGHGLTVTVSSIHINAWVGLHDKWAGACWAVRSWLGRDLKAEVGRWVYIGDSANDQAMFRHCPHSIAVSNIAPYWGQLHHFPAYVTAGQRGFGFAEMVQALLDVK
ncbi:MAG: HAD-IIB family hydrolase [Alphaproteobacteria bacterium]|nr:HAD-IIB family hydrolase [Alphaproteobacteria bacterium]